MKKLKTKLTCLSLVIAMVISAMTVSGVNPVKTKAAEKAYCEGLNLNYNLELNKKQTFTGTGIYYEYTLFKKKKAIDIKYTVTSKRKSVGKNYKVTYKNSLYRKVKNILQSSNSSKYGDYSINPTYLTGNAKINVELAYAPTYTMNIEVLENDTIIQMPLIYYPGYEITAKNITSNEVIKIKGENIDGLVSFALSEGQYVVTTDFVGTTARKISVVWFSISLGVTTLSLIYAIIERKKDKQYVIQESK